MALTTHSPSNAEVEEREELYSSPLLGLRGLFWGEIYFLLLRIITSMRLVLESFEENVCELSSLVCF